MSQAFNRDISSSEAASGEGARVTFVLDKELRVLALDGPVEAFSGLRREDYLGKTAREAGVEAETCDALELACDRCMVGRSAQKLDISDGGRRFRLQLRPRLGPDGRVIGVAGAVYELGPQLPAETTWQFADLFRRPPTQWPLRVQQVVGVVAATFGVGLAAAVRKMLLGAEHGDAPLFLIFLIPVIAAAAIGGLWPGLLATALGTFVGAVMLVEPGFTGPALPEYVRVGVFVTEGVLISVVCGLLRTALARATHAESVARTAAEQLQESEQQFRELANAMPQIVWAARPDGFTDYYNDRWYQFTGASRDHFGDGSWETCLHPEDAPRAHEVFYRAVETGTPYEIEYRIKDAGGAYRWFLGRALPARDRFGRIIRWYGSSTDIDQQRQTIAELEALRRELEQRVADRTREVQQRNDELRRLAVELCNAEQRERRNISVILHDHLQQLLAAAKMHIEASPATRESAENLAAARDLVSQALEDARTLAVELSPPVLHDRGLLAGLQWLAKHMRARHQLKVVVEGNESANPLEPEVRDFLFAAARELLFNVVKHARADEARLTLARNGDEVELAVEDHGIGCDGARSLADKGGFGLFNISQRTELLGGRFQFRSAPKAGCRVVLIMMAPAGESQSGADRSPLGDGERAADRRATVRVLLVDDHRILREGLAALLMREPGIEVVAEAQDGLIACEMARRLRPDVIIMDVSMPNMDGIEATRVIKKEMPQTRVIALSMHNRDDMAHTMQEAGADTYFTKGSPIAELARAIRSLS